MTELKSSISLINKTTPKKEQNKKVSEYLLENDKIGVLGFCQKCNGSKT